MNKFLKIGLLVAVIVVLIVVLIVALLKDEALTYVDALLAQHACAIREANKVNDAVYRCREGRDSHVTITIESVLTSDFDADGKAETFVVWSAHFGGTGVFKYQGIFDGADTMKSKTNIGDRVIIDNVEVEKGLIVMDLITHNQDDPLCCPTLKITKHFEWDGQALIPYSEVAGK